MTTIQVFDPALCCSTGVCGVEVDQALVGFAADVDWARAQGATIERFNLAQQPMAFAENAAVKAALQRSGEAALPLLLRDGQVLLSGRYPARSQLALWLGLTTASARLSAIGVAATPASACCSPSAAAASTQESGGSKCC